VYESAADRFPGRRFHMSDSRLSYFLTNASNVAIIVSALVVVVGLVVPGRPASRQPNLLPQPGDTLSKLAVVNYSDARVTAILFLRSDCRYCNDSMAFYKRLVARCHTGRPERRVIAVTLEDIDSVIRHLAGYGVRLDSVHTGQAHSFGVTGTPTVILVNASGIVVGSFAGRLPAQTEQEVLRLVDEQ
jgi:hypothetical protein